MATASRTLQSEVARGLGLHHAGDLAGAARLYEAALARDPDDTDATCLLGVVRQQQGRAAEAVALIERAAAARPDVPAYHASLGMAYQVLGRLPEAGEAFGRVLALCPDDPAAHVNWGVVSRSMGQREKALEHFRRAADLDPRLAEARTNLGEILLELGRPAEALAHCRAAVALQPDLAEAHLKLANVLRLLGQLEEARASYHEALRLEPTSGQAAAGLGIVAVRLNLRDEGLAWLRRAVELEPSSIEFLRYLGEAAAAYGLPEEVRACCDRILEVDPNYAPAHNTLGWFAHQQGRRDDARAHYVRAIELEPALANGHFNLGLLHEEDGERDEAVACYRNALRCDPAHATSLARLASMQRGAMPEDEFRSIHRLLCEPNLPPIERVKLLFAVADVHDGRRETARAADWLRRANAMAREQLVHRGNPYDPAEHRRFVDALIAGFTPSLFERLAGAGLDSTRPVFIIGMPRSGTTLIEHILASHPDVHGAGEIALARRSFQEIPELLATNGDPASLVTQLSPPLIDELARRHDRRLREIDGGRSARIINKMPENYFYLGLIAMMFPRAVVIHCRRDPRDVALSCWAANFIEVRWAHHYEHIASRFAEYRRLIDHWRAVLPASFALHEVSYEETVDDLEGVSRRLLAALGMDWHPACLEFHRTRRTVQTASQNQVRRPIYRSSVGRWKLYETELAELFAMIDSGGDAQ